MHLEYWDLVFIFLYYFYLLNYLYLTHYLKDQVSIIDDNNFNNHSLAISLIRAKTIFKLIIILKKDET